MSEFIEMMNKLKEVIPEENFRKEPEHSFSKILMFENEYKMNTSDALELYIELDEEIHHNDNYTYLWCWINEYQTYEIFNGDMSKINSQ